MKIGFLISKEEIEKIKKYVTYFYNCNSYRKQFWEKKIINIVCIYKIKFYRRNEKFCISQNFLIIFILFFLNI